MAKYIRVKGGGYQDTETTEFIPEIKKSPTNSAQVRFKKWCDAGNEPDPISQDKAVETLAKEYEVLQCRISWDAAKAEKLSIEAELLVQLERVRAELAALRG